VLLAHDTVKILAGTTTGGPYGGDRLDWTTPTVVSVERANVQPAMVDESVVNEQRIEARFEVRIRPDATVDETNRVRWDQGGGEGEQDYEVIAVRPWRHGPTALRHTHLVIQRVEEG